MYITGCKMVNAFVDFGKEALQDDSSVMFYSSMQLSQISESSLKTLKTSVLSNIIFFF